MNTSITQQNILQIIELILGHRPIEVDAPLIETYGAESADIANIVVALEQKYALHIPESDLPNLRTPRDFFNLVKQNIRHS